MATRHRTPVAPGYRAWAACVIVLQCERGGRPVTAVYGFWALLYSAFGAQDLSDEAATTSLLGTLAAAFALAVRVIATMSMGDGRAAAAAQRLVELDAAEPRALDADAAGGRRAQRDRLTVPAHIIAKADLDITVCTHRFSTSMIARVERHRRDRHSGR